MSVNWQDAPVTFQLERASVLQPSGQISENRSSRAELSAIRKASLYQTPNAPLTLTSGTAGGSVRAAKGRLCDGTKWCSVGHGQTVCTLLASKGKRHWHWLILLTLLNMKRVVGSLKWSGLGSPIRWATPVVCTEHGPLKCTLTFIRISLTPIMGEPANLEGKSTVSCDFRSPRESFMFGRVYLNTAMKVGELVIYWKHWSLSFIWFSWDFGMIADRCTVWINWWPTFHVQLCVHSNGQLML